MSVGILKEINELLVEDTFDLTDEEALSYVGREGYPNSRTINDIQVKLLDAIKTSRAKRLEAAKTSYARDKNSSSAQLSTLSSKKTLNQMLADIVSAMQTPDKVPEGLLIAFREQSKNTQASEKDIREIWESLVKLGLIQGDDEL